MLYLFCKINNLFAGEVMKKIIKFEKVSKVYNLGNSKFYALDKIEFEINEGELVVILGPSGAGKTTLLNLIGGMDIVTSGAVLFDGKDITKYSDNKLTKYRALNIGFVFQSYNLIPTLTVYENVALIKDIDKNALEAKEVLKAVGLENKMNQFPSQLSGGEQQRTSIARAICKKPKILLCDEPTGALDTVTGKEILYLLQKMSIENKQTVVLVTHNEMFTDIANKIIKVKNGKIENIIINDTPKKVNEVNW